MDRLRALGDRFSALGDWFEERLLPLWDWFDQWGDLKKVLAGSVVALFLFSSWLYCLGFLGLIAMNQRTASAKVIPTALATTVPATVTMATQEPTATSGSLERPFVSDPTPRSVPVVPVQPAMPAPTATPARTPAPVATAVATRAPAASPEPSPTARVPAGVTPGLPHLSPSVPVATSAVPVVTPGVPTTAAATPTMGQGLILATPAATPTRVVTPAVTATRVPVAPNPTSTSR